MLDDLKRCQWKSGLSFRHHEDIKYCKDLTILTRKDLHHEYNRITHMS